MQDPYKILEITPQATFEEIKASYRSLCKEYHPDKLPPGTPEKARRYIEERFKQINEAYSVLSDAEKRQQHDLSYSSNASSSQDFTSNKSSNVFDSEKLGQVAERLEALKQKIEAEHEEIKKEIDQSVKQQIQALGYREEDLHGDTFLGKVGIVIFALLLACGGLWLMGLGNGLLWLIGITWTGFWLLVCLVIVLSPTLSTKAAQKIKPIREKANADKLKAQQKRQQQLDNLQRHQRQRVDFFKSIPIQTLSEDYIADLSDEDQLYLLQAIQERQDAEQLSQNLKTAARVVAGLGLLAAMFGLGIPGL